MRMNGTLQIFSLMSHGIILKRMLKTVMILLKKEDQPYIHRLRHILSVEVEVQEISSSQWARKFAQSSERNKIVTES